MIRSCIVVVHLLIAAGSGHHSTRGHLSGYGVCSSVTGRDNLPKPLEVALPERLERSAQVCCTHETDPGRSCCIDAVRHFSGIEESGRLGKPSFEPAPRDAGSCFDQAVECTSQRHFPCICRRPFGDPNRPKQDDPPFAVEAPWARFGSGRPEVAGELRLARDRPPPETIREDTVDLFTVPEHPKALFRDHARRIRVNVSSRTHAQTPIAGEGDLCDPSCVISAEQGDVPR